MSAVGAVSFEDRPGSGVAVLDQPSTYDRIRQRLLASYLEYGIQTDDELWYFVRHYLGWSIPRQHSCPEHSAPFAFLADQFFYRVKTVFGWANRNGGKTLLVAILNVVEALVKGGIEILAAAAIEQQAIKGYEYVTKMLFGDPLLLRTMVSSLRSMTEFFNGSTIKITTGTWHGLNSPHPNRFSCDEIELMHWTILQEGMQMSITSPDGQWRAADCYTSTRKFGNGTVQRLLDEKKDVLSIYSWCVPPGTPIELADGTYCPVEAVGIGDEVRTHTGQARPVTALFRRAYAGELIELRIQGLPGLLRLTPEHKVPLRGGAWVEAGQLRPGLQVLDPRISLVPGGDYEEGWLIGYYLAEGCIIRKGAGLSFGCHADEVAFVQARFSTWWGKNQIAYPRRGPRATGPRVYYRKGTKTAVIECYHPGLRALVEKWVDLDLKAPRKRLRRLPVSRELARGILEGWLYGDGSRHKGRIVGQTASEQLCRQMFRIAVSLGHAASAFTGMNRPAPRERQAGIAKTAPFWRVTVPSARPHHNKAEITEAVCYRKIKTVGRVPYEGIVCDLTVAEDHSFLANGIAISNCIWEILQPCTRQCKGDPVYGDCGAYSRLDKEGKEEMVCGLGKGTGRAQQLPPGGFYKIEDFVSKVKTLDKDTWETQWLNERPSSGALVYGNYYKDEAPFVVGTAEAQELLERARTEGWQRVLAIDFGANFYGAYLMQDPHTDIWYLYHEYWYSADQDLALQHHGRNLIKTDPLTWSGATCAYGDPAARQAIRDLEYFVYTLPDGTIEEYTLLITPANNDVYSGISKMKELLTRQLHDKLPRLRLFAGCARARQELSKLYVHKSNKDGTVNRDVIIKANDHAADAIRYGLNSFYTIGAMTVTTSRLKGVF